MSEMVTIGVATARKLQEKTFSEIEYDLEYEVGELLIHTGASLDYPPDYWIKWNSLSKRQKTEFLLAQAAKVHDLAKRLLEAAIREEREQAS